MTTYKFLTAKQNYIGDFKNIDEAWKEAKRLNIPVIYIQEFEEVFEEQVMKKVAKG